MTEELIKIMEFIRDERMNALGEEDQERSFRLDKAMSKIHTRLNTLLQNENQEKAQIRKAEYTFEELQEVYNNPRKMTEEEIKNTFIEDDEPIDLSELKIKKI